jgi:hypothetical protein
MGLATVVAVLLMLDAGRIEPTAPRPRAFTALWTDMAGCGVDRRDVEAAVRTGLEPLGVSVDWKTVRGFETSGPDTVRVVVVRSRKSALDPRTMGSSNPGSPSPAIWVQYDQVLRALGEAEGVALVDRTRLGIAVGRVVAHEFVHLLAPGRKHDGTGLFAERLNANALVAPRTRLSDAFVRWFRADSGTAPPLAAAAKMPASTLNSLPRGRAVE